MITLVPNIYIRHYFQRTGLLTEQRRRQTDHNMKSGELPSVSLARGSPHGAEW